MESALIEILAHVIRAGLDPLVTKSSRESLVCPTDSSVYDVSNGTWFLFTIGQQENIANIVLIVGVVIAVVVCIVLSVVVVIIIINKYKQHKKRKDQ